MLKLRGIIKEKFMIKPDRSPDINEIAQLSMSLKAKIEELRYSGRTHSDDDLGPALLLIHNIKQTGDPKALTYILEAINVGRGMPNGHPLSDGDYQILKSEAEQKIIN